MTVRILLADDHELVREGLRSLLEEEDDLQVIACAGDGEEAVRKALDLKPDIVIMDINMPKLNGIQATRQLLQQLPGVKVLSLSVHRSSVSVKSALSAGASGYMLKDCAGDEIIAALHEIAEGKQYLSPSVSEQAG